MTHGAILHCRPGSPSDILTRSVILTYMLGNLHLYESKRPIWQKLRGESAMSLGMDDQDGFIWLDGKLVPWRDSRLHVLTHALHYGSAVFEGERIYDGRVFRLAAHSQRLINSAHLLDYEIPPGPVSRLRRRRAPWSRPTSCSRVMCARLPGAARRGWGGRGSAPPRTSPPRRGRRGAGCRCRRAPPASTSPWPNTAVHRPTSPPATPRWRVST